MTPLSRSLSGEIPHRPPPPPPGLDWIRIGAVFAAATSLLGVTVSVGLTVFKFLADCRCAATPINTCDDGVTRFLPALAGVFDCTAAFSSAYSQLLGLPLTVYAAALYAVTLVLAVAAARRGPSAPLLVAWLFLLALVDVAVSCVLFAVSSWVLHAWCLFCFCLYFVSAALLASAALALHGLRPRPWPLLRNHPRLPSNLAAIAGLVVLLHAVPYAARCDRREPGCFRPVPQPPDTFLRLGADDPEVVLLALVDPTCSACAGEFLDLQTLVAADHGLQVRFLHFPREFDGCGFPGVRVPAPMLPSVNAGACDLAFAVECLAERGGPDSDDGVRALEYVLATQGMTPARAHLSAALDAFVVDREARGALDRCVHARKGAAARRVADHLRYGVQLKVDSTPTLLVVPVVADLPRWELAQMLPGRGTARLRRAIDRARSLRADDPSADAPAADVAPPPPTP